MTTNQAIQHSKPLAQGWAKWAWAALELVLAYAVIENTGLLGLALVGTAAVELRGGYGPKLSLLLREEAVRRAPELVLALSVVLLMGAIPRRASQLGLLAAFGVWLWWRARATESALSSLAHLLLVQAVMFEAIFLTAAVKQTPAWLVLVLVWAGSYVSVYSTLKRRGDRSAGVMAATWAVIATEVSWVLMLWLVTYVLQKNGFLMVPQPALVLTALAYVFGNILLASRQGTLSRARLAEYLIIGLILVLIVVVETLWRHAA